MAVKERVAIYASDLSDRDIETKKVSLWQQIKHCEHELEVEDVNIVQAYGDVLVEQPTLQKLLSDAKAGGIDRIAMTNLSKLASAHEERIRIVKEIAEARASIRLTLIAGNFVMTFNDLSAYMPVISEISRNPDDVGKWTVAYTSTLSISGRIA
jgi:DNA invertase Pin-like site-specific DNA recombinase